MKENVQIVTLEDGRRIVKIDDIIFKGKRGTAEKAKANASKGIAEMIEIAHNKVYSENHKEKHSRDAGKGWYRYTSRFALPVFGMNNEIERYV